MNTSISANNSIGTGYFPVPLDMSSTIYNRMVTLQELEIYPRDLEAKLVPVDAQRYPWIYRCNDPRCERFSTCHETEQAALAAQQQHKRYCPIVKPTRKGERYMQPNPNGFPGGESKTGVEMLWDLLDEATAAVMNGEPEEEDPILWQVYNEKRGNARGLAMALHVLCRPFYADSTAVAKLAVARYRARSAGTELPPTVGIDGYRGTTATPTATPAPAPTAPPAPITLEPRDLAALEVGIRAGLPIKSLANVYKLTEEQVNHLAANMK